MLRYFSSFTLLMVAYLGSAQAYAPNTFPANTVGNLTTFGSGTVGGGNLGASTLSFASDGTVLTKGPVTFNGAGVAKVTADLTSKVSKAAVAKAVANFAFNAVPGALLLLSTVQLLGELGYGLSLPGSSTPYTQTKPLGGDWYNADRGLTPTYPSAQAVCDAFNTFPGGPNRFDILWDGYRSCSSASAGGNVSGSIVYRTAITGTSTVPLTRQEFEDAVAAKSGWPTTSKLADAFKEALQSGEVVQAQPQVLTGPATSPGQRTVTTNPDGTTTVTNTTNNYTYEGNTVTVTTTTITQNFSPSGQPVGSPTTTVTTPVLDPMATPTPATPAASTPSAPTAPASAPKETITCGLPSTPPCKIDETGTKSDAGTTFEPSKTAIDAAKTDAATAIGNAANIAAPVWSFTFALPTGCAPYVTGLKGVILNVCQYQSTIHGLLSAIWAAATVFAMIGMVGRTIRES